MPRKKKTLDAKPIEQYTHSDKDRVNNPPVGLVTPETDKEAGKQIYAYDPHFDPQLQWAGKAEHTSFEVPIVSLHVHERIDPRTIIEAVRRRHEEEAGFQNSLFESERVNLPLFKAVEFYKHRHNWSNRLIAGDSLLVMNSLLVKEGMAGGVQMVYFDPPYGIKYGSNFQPFVNKREVKDGRDEDLTAEPETLKAFRDTWELRIHSYLTYMRDRLLLARELLHESGSIFVQISDENVHLVRNLLDEVFGAKNFISLIPVVKTSGLGASGLARVADFLLWYGRNAEASKYRQLYVRRDLGDEGAEQYSWVELPDKSRRRMLLAERQDPSSLPDGARAFRLDNLTSGAFRENTTISYKFKGRVFHPGTDKCWKTTKEGLDILADNRRIEIIGNTLAYVRFIDDFPLRPLKALWTDTGTGGFGDEKLYIVQTTTKIIQRCMLMTTDPGDLVLDITCGSGTTAYVAEQWGRRWITCDTSRVALTLAKQRLMTASFEYYQLAKPEEGISSGFKYKTVPHVTLKSIANNEPPVQETLYDQPLLDKNIERVTSPFTVEAVPAPVVQTLHEVTATTPTLADNSIARSGETLRQAEWRNELLRTGIRGRRGEKMQFSRVEPLAGTRALHADAEISWGGGGVSPLIS
jgi:adenine-specific DNA-methyltransferase